MAETYGAKALDVALREVGVKEHPAGSNDGPRIHQYQQATGAYRQPWCASFAQWCYSQAGAKQPCASGFVPTLVTWYQTRHRGLTNAEVRPGDWVMYDWQNDGTADHIGLFKRWMDARKQSFEAVEGNTAVGNESNGGQVMIRLRFVADVALFARPVASRLTVGTKFDPLTGTAKKSLVKKVAAKVLPYKGRH